MKLSIGCACFDDFDGVYFTIQALRLMHAEVMSQTEILVIDNNPTSHHGEAVQKLLHWVQGDVAAARYIPFPEPKGTAAPRDQIFRQARGEIVLCLDAHVLIVPGALRRLIEWFDERPDCLDLISGPLLYDDLRNRATHFADQWRGEMWGTWATDPRGDPFQAEYQDAEFEIPAQGLGLFGCRRQAWLGFNENFRGFGGEEFYIHEKFRRAGRRCLCLPWLLWLHRFGRPDGVRYPLSRWQKVRNYILGHQELGLPLDRLYAHFVGEKLLTEAEWQNLLEDPVGRLHPPGAAPSGGCSSCELPAEADLEFAFQWTKERKRDMENLMDRFRQLAAEAERITAFVKRKEWDVTLLAGRPKKLRVFTTEPHAIHMRLKDLATETDYVFAVADSPMINEIEETDLLVLHTIHTAERIYDELSRFAPRVSRRILVRSTGTFGEVGEPGGPGLLVGIRRYLREHPEWSVIEHSLEQYGYTLLSRDPADKPPLPTMTRMAWNYGTALLKHVMGGMKYAEQKIIEERLNRCAICEQRTDGNRCAVCGCFLDVGPNERAGKALWAESECPLGRWTQ